MIEKFSFFTKGRLNTKVVGKEVVFLEETGSTNDDAFKLAVNGVEEGWVVIARNQLKGKGSRGKVWTSPGGQNIYFSVILRPKVSTEKASLLTILSTLAVAETINDYIPKGVSIKWPNDVLVSEKKISGILLEMGTDRNKDRFFIVGIGINVNSTTLEIPPVVSGLATSLYLEIGYAVSIKDVLFKLIYRLDHWYGKYITYGFEEIIERFRTQCSTIGKMVSVTVGEGVIEGLALGVDEDGFLLVEDDDGVVKKVISGHINSEV